jgi:CRISPR-associated endonuclease Cas3-HD
MGTRFSHPPEDGRDGVLLEDHLADVAGRVSYVVPDDAETPAGESLQSVVETLAWVHDLGKATSYFQQYLGVIEGTPKKRSLRYHAPLGSFAAYEALDAQGFDTETCLAGFVAVGKHHGQIPDIAEYVVDRTHRPDGEAGRSDAASRQDAVMHQIKDVHENVPELAQRVFENATNGRGDWLSFATGFQSLLGEIEETVGTSVSAYGVDRDALSSSCYGLVLQCWSALVLADKTCAARAPNAERTYAPEQPRLDHLDEYVRDLEATVSAKRDGTRSERLNYYRSEARSDVLDNAAAFADDGGGIATLTLPTGMGKTLTGLSAALSVRDGVDGERVVYALPFTSIIDQVVDDLEDIYETDTTGRLLTAHHHLSETVIRESEEQSDDADRRDDVAGMLGESWRAGLTVTTFVQLFESLAGPGNRQSMKLPALKDSVVVLDEPQSLPLDWWKLVPRLATLLTEQYGATVIAMTATQPELFDDATPLVDEPETYFETASRVRYTLDQSTERYIADQAEPKSYDAASAELETRIAEGESILAICNTIDSARTLTERVTERLAADAFVDVAEAYADALSGAGSAESVDPVALANDLERECGTPILHLSTRIRPGDRLKLVETAKQLTADSRPLLTISTQLVEAGVDISFDRVYRDFAPIDSVVQAAGRCNRSFEREQGDVVVWWLAHPADEDKTPAEAVYNRGTSLLPVAASTLQSVRDQHGSLTETSVARDAVQEFYRRLHEQKDVGKQTWADYVDDADGEKLGRLSLIDQGPTADVLVCRTGRDRDLVERLLEANRAYDFEKLRRLLSETKPLRISVPFYREDSAIADAIEDLPLLLDDEGIYVLDVRDSGAHFDRTQGFVVPESTVDNQFL